MVIIAEVQRRRLSALHERAGWSALAGQLLAQCRGHAFAGTLLMSKWSMTLFDQ